ncbi:MAG: hypothetical protein ACKPEQ_34825, partial [Dolichospermum sp.]
MAKKKLTKTSEKVMCIENVNIKTNPVTTLLGGVFMSISATMYCIKYILPAFFELKSEVPYEWHTPFWPLLLGLT